MRTLWAWNTFTPKSAYDITDISPGLQRQWRNRGYLPSTNGQRAAYTGSDLARILLVDDLIQSGVSIELDDNDWMIDASKMIAYHALLKGGCTIATVPSELACDKLEQLTSLHADIVKSLIGEIVEPAVTKYVVLGLCGGQIEAFKFTDTLDDLDDDWRRKLVISLDGYAELTDEGSFEGLGAPLATLMVEDPNYPERSHYLINLDGTTENAVLFDPDQVPPSLH